MSSAMQTVFQHQSLRTRVVSKPGAVGELGRELEKLGCRKPLLLSSRRTATSGLYGQVGATLEGWSVAEFKDIPQHSSIASVMAVAALAREQGVDALVAVGGGSVVDTAKAAALVLAEGGPLEKHASRFVPPATVITPDLVRPKLPIIAIPTTASGAEVTPSLGIRTEDGTKLLFWDAQLASHVILLDPLANLEMPASVMLATGMNGLAHCIEGLYSKGRSPIASVLALDGVAQFDRALRRVAATPENPDARAELLLAAHVSGMVLATARSCLHHAICHVLGATYNVGHGQANSIILPHAVRFNAPAAKSEMAAIAQKLELSGTDPVQAVIDWICDLQRATGVPHRLRDLDIDRGSLRSVAEKTAHERGLAYNPCVAGPDEIESILAAAW